MAAKDELSRVVALLDDQERRTGHYNLGWRIGFTGAFVTQGALALTDPFDVSDDARANLWVGTVKSGVSAALKFVLPLKHRGFVAVPGESPCVAVERARAALRYTARKQKGTFWLNHLGAVVFNVTGALVLGLGYDTWSTALTSSLSGYAVGLAHTYTMPRGAWHADRSGGLAVAVTPMLGPSVRGLSVTLVW